MRVSVRSLVLLAAVILSYSVPLVAEDKDREYSFTSRLENDVGFSDRFYTNGLYFSFQTATGEDDILNYLNPAYWIFLPFASVPSYARAPDEFLFSFFKESSAMNAGLDTYTPQHLNKTGISYGDHPYYSRQYAGTSYEISSYRHYFKTEWDYGRSGPGTLSEDGQKKIHFLSRNVSEYPNGWDKQGPSAMSLNTSMDYRLRFYLNRGYGSEAISFQIHPRLGTANTDIEIGAEYRLAYAATYSEMMYIGESMYLLPGVARFAWYMRPSLSYVGYDASLEGNYGEETAIYRYNRSLSHMAFHYLAFKMQGEPGSIDEFFEREQAFRYLVDKRNTYDFRQDFLRFNTVFYYGSLEHAGEQLLIYQLLFKEGKPYEFEGRDRDFEMKNLALLSIAAERPAMDPENLYFWRYTIFRKEGESVPEEVRWIAFEKMTDRTNMTAEEKVFIYTALFTGGHLRPLPYGVPPIRLLLNLDTGVSFRLGNSVIWLKFRSVSPRFERGKDIRSLHNWWSAAATFRL